MSSGAEASPCVQAQALIKRTYLLKDVGLEIFFSGRNSLYLTFKTSADREKLAGKPQDPGKAPKYMHSISRFPLVAM